MRPRILVLTLYSGENEFEAGKASLAAQTISPVDQVVISGLGNVDAHRTLYERVMEDSTNYDLFLKLDADMVLSRPTALEEVVAYFESHENVDHVEVAVRDHFTGALIPGVHVYTNRAVWRLDAHDRLFVDPRPVYPGRYTHNPPELPPFVDHAPDPNAYQSFHFGYHRALKAFQPGRAVKRLSGVVANTRTLRRIRRKYEATDSEILAFALIAADLVERGELGGASGDKATPELVRAFETIRALSPEERRARASRGSSIGFRRFLWWTLILPAACFDAASRLCLKTGRRVAFGSFGSGDN